MANQEKSLGKIILDNSGITKLLSGTENIEVNVKIPLKEKEEIKDLRNEIKQCNTTVEIDVEIDKAGLAQVEGLSQHIKELHAKGKIDELTHKDVNELISNQNNTNIAKQAHGIIGVKKAIDKYNESLSETSDINTTKLVTSIETSNSALGKYLVGLNGGTAGLKAYGVSLVTATVKTFALEAATTALNMAMSFGVSFLFAKGIELITKGFDALNLTVEEQEQKVSKLTSAYESLQSEYDTLSQKQDLTDAEKRRLEYLEKRLELDRQILEAETKAFHQNKVGTSWIDIIDNDSLRNKRFDEENPFNANSFSNLHGKTNTLLNSYKGNEASGSMKAMEVNLRELEEVYPKLLTKQAEFLENMETAQAGVDNLTGDSKEKAEKALQYWTDQYNAVVGLTNEVGALIGETTEYGDAVSDVEIPEVKPKQPELWDYSETITQLDTVKEKLSTLDQTYSKLFDGEKDTNINFDDLYAINEAFADVEGIDEYIKRLQEAGQDTEQVAAVMEDLIDAYLQQSNILSNVTDENKDLIASMLQEMGIANAEEIVLSQLSAQTEILALQKQFLTENEHNVTEATVQEINEFLNMSEASDIAKQSIAQLALESMDFANTDLNTNAKIDDLINLANAAGASATAITKAKQAMNLVNAFDSGDYKVNNIGDLKKLEYAQKTYDSIVNKMYDWDYEPLNANDFKITNSSKYKPTYSPQNITGTETAKTQDRLAKSTDKVKDSTDKATDAIKEQTEALEKQKDALEESKAELESLGSAIIDVLDDEIDKLHEQEEEIQDAIDKWKSLGDAIQWFLGGKDEELDKLIDKLKEANDTLQNDLDGMDSVLAVIDRVYADEIKLIQDKIDALDEANDAKEKEIALEEARIALEEARSRKSLLVYQKGLGFTYHTDDRAIKEAESNLADLEAQAESDAIKEALEKQKEDIQELKDAFAEIPNAYKEAMEELEAIAKYGTDYKSAILGAGMDSVENFKGEYTGIQTEQESNNSKIDLFEDQKAQIQDMMDFWEEATEKFADKQKEAELKLFFGSDYESAILDGSLAKWNEYVTGYKNAQNQLLDIQNQIANVESIKATWEDAINAYEVSQDRARLATFFGSDYQYELLNNSSAWISKYVDEYASIMSQIEDVELQIKNVTEQTATDIENTSTRATEALNGTSGAVKEYQDTVTSTPAIGDYIWTAKDEAALEAAKQKSAELNRVIGEETSGAAYEAKTKLDEFISSYSGLKESKVVTDDLTSSMNGLRDSENEYLSGMYAVADGVASRINDSRSYVADLSGTVQEASDTISSVLSSENETFNGLAQSIGAVKQAIDDKTAAIQNEGVVVEETVNGEIQKFDELKQKLGEVVTAISGVEGAESQVEEDAEVAVTDVGTTVSTVLEKIGTLNTALTELEDSRAALKEMVDQVAMDTDQTISSTGDKVAEVRLAIDELLTAITNLQTALVTLIDTMSTLDAVTLANVIAQVGFLGDEGTYSLYGAIHSVIQAIIGEGGLIEQLTVLDAVQLDNIIKEFGGDADSLLDAVRRVTYAVYKEGDDNCLTTRINKLTETIANITQVERAFNLLEAQALKVRSEVEKLHKEIDDLPTRKDIYIYTHKITLHGEASGTAHTGKGYASGTAKTNTANAPVGKAYASGSWGLQKDEPKSIVGELGTEIVVRNGSYFTVDFPQLLDLKKGDIVFNHEQTKAILDRGKTSNINRLSKLGFEAVKDVTLKGQSFLLGTANNPFDGMENLLKYAPYTLNIPNINHNFQHLDYVKKDTGKKVEISIGDIVVQGVQDTNSLSKAIVRQLPNKILQEIGKL